MEQSVYDVIELHKIYIEKIELRFCFFFKKVLSY